MGLHDLLLDLHNLAAGVDDATAPSWVVTPTDTVIEYGVTLDYQEAWEYSTLSRDWKQVQSTFCLAGFSLQASQQINKLFNTIFYN